jgi:hypothetical protein
MATKRKQDDGGIGLLLILSALTLAQFILFGLFTYSYHRDLMNRYYRTGGDGLSIRRINDIHAVLKPLGAIMFGPTVILLICVYLIAQADGISSKLFVLLLESPFLLLWLWLSVICFKWLAVAHFGVIVDPENDRIVFRFDQESYDLVDYLKLKFIRDLPRIDEVRLSDIGRITRKIGFDLYLSGSFGSRRITFTNKQKRDECNYAIQNSGRTSAKVPVEFGI